MKSDKIFFIILLAFTCVSALYIWPGESALYFVLAFVVRFGMPTERRKTWFIVLCSLVAAAVVDSFIIDYRVNSVFLIGRHIGALVVCLAMLRGHRKESEDYVKPARHRTVSRILSVVTFLMGSFGTFVGGGVLIFQSRPQNGTWAIFAIGVFLLTAHTVMAIQARRPRWGRSSLLYLPGMLVTTVFLAPLAWDLFFLTARYDVEEYGRRGVSIVQEQLALPPVFSRNPAMEAVVKSSWHSSARVRRRCVFAFGTAARREGLAAELEDSSNKPGEWWDRRYDRGDAAGPFVRRILPRMIQLLDDEDQDVRLTTLQAFGMTGPVGHPAVPAILNLLDKHGISPDSQQSDTGNAVVDTASDVSYLMESFAENRRGEVGARILVAEALGSIGPRAEAAIPELILLLNDVIPQVRKASAEALGGMGPFAAEAKPSLGALANNASDIYEVRLAAVMALSRIDRDDRSPDLIVQEILKNGTKAGQVEAAMAIKYLGPQTADWAIPALIPFAVHEDTELRHAAMSSLCEIGPDSVDAVSAILLGLRPEIQAGSFGSSWDVESSFNRLNKNSRGAAATALVDGIKAIRQSAVSERNGEESPSN